MRMFGDHGLYQCGLDNGGASATDVSGGGGALGTPDVIRYMRKF